jgi:uncharacterized SAM-binding protein YcdF (DUF218 family)
MFLFLSKLLPLLIYPLGFACLMLLVALATLWVRRWLAALSILVALLVLVAGSNGWVATLLYQSLEWQNLPLSNLPNANAIVVLGGGIRPKVPPRPWVDLSEAGDRALHGAQLYKQGKAPLIIMSGGRIDWKGGGPPESADMAEVAKALGVPESAILQDPTSLNTFENAANVKKIVEQRGIKQVLLVTSALHMPRSLAIFAKQGIVAIPAPTDFLVSNQDLDELKSSSEALTLNLMPDAERLQQTTRAIKEYVGMVVYRLRGWL